MSSLNHKTEDGVLTIFIEGRMDSTSAPQVEAKIEEIRSQIDHTSLVVDFEKLEYISSAGLRVILRLSRNEPTLRVENVPSEAYDIFEMTGFTEMMPITKAYRRLSVEGCDVIGRGANGEVYRIDDDTIVKVYFNPDALPDIKRERALARRAFVLGIPTAIPYDVVKVGDGYGSVFELLNAQSFANLINEHPQELDKYVRLYVRLLKKIHSTVVKPEDMPDMRDIAIGWAEFLLDYLPQDKAEKLISLVKAVPVDHHMLHGDYHIKNVMMQNSEVLLIDMDTLCHGNPIFELASMFNAYKGFSELDNTATEKFIGVSHETAGKIWEKVLPEYLGTDDEQRIVEVEQKAMLIGYTRLMRRLIRRNGFETEQGRKEIETYKNHIIDLLDKIDTLVI